MPGDVVAKRALYSAYIAKWGDIKVQARHVRIRMGGTFRKKYREEAEARHKHTWRGLKKEVIEMEQRVIIARFFKRLQSVIHKGCAIAFTPSGIWVNNSKCEPVLYGKETLIDALWSGREVCFIRTLNGNVQFGVQEVLEIQSTYEAFGVPALQRELARLVLERKNILAFYVARVIDQDENKRGNQYSIMDAFELRQTGKKFIVASTIFGDNLPLGSHGFEKWPSGPISWNSRALQRRKMRYIKALKNFL